MNVRGVVWLGTRTDRLDEMVRFYEQVMGLQRVADHGEYVEFRLPNGDAVEVFGPGDPDHQHFTTGPVAGFEVDDVPTARAEMEARGIQFMGPVHDSGGYRWSHFRAPDGNIYELASFAPSLHPPHVRDGNQIGDATTVHWPDHLPVVQIRVARPTDRLDELVRFYRDGLGLAVIDSFGGEGHAGYTGVMLGLPGHAYHLEFTEHEHGSPCPAPTKDNLLVFYIPDHDAIHRLLARLEGLGYSPVPPENPYWAGRGVTVEDPDGWRIVLMNTPGI